jgi:dTDP-glucose 4,6-dehydratase
VKILVCGGAGFIGSNFVKYVLEKHAGAKVTVYDKLTYAGNLQNLEEEIKKGLITFVKGDITDGPKVSELVKGSDYVINFAAETHVDRSIHDGAKEFIMSNVLGVQTILDAVRDSSVKKFVQVSTDEVYGSLALNDSQKFLEDTPFAPNVPYAAAKAGGDLMCRAYFNTFGVPVVVTHCSNNYGPYQYPEKLIPFFILRAMDNKPLPLYGDGLNVRDWIYVKDHCEALEMLLMKAKAGEVYNIGADNERSNIDIARLILRYIGKSESLLTFVADRPGHDRRYAIDASKIRRDLGWSPRYRFEEALPKTIEWYLSHKEWIENIKQRGSQFNMHIKC